MGDAPDKPDPTGLLRLAEQLLQGPLGDAAAPVAYLGDTVADVLTVQRAREQRPQQRFISLAVPPPHLQAAEAAGQREHYGEQLRAAGADQLLERTDQVLAVLEPLLA
jgi:HAD superfamily phosphatase